MIHSDPLGHANYSANQVGACDRRVDIVDDDASVRKALVRLLTSIGLRSNSYGSARIYLESADLELTDCLLLDLHLPGMSGIELLEHLSEVAPSLPVICMNGRDEPMIDQRLAAAGIRWKLRKPFDEAELFEALSTLIGLTRLPPPHGTKVQKPVHSRSEHSS